MIRKLVKHGDSWALVIDQPMLELLQISDQTPLELLTKEGSLVVSPVREVNRQEQLQQSLDQVNQDFGKELQQLGE